jgi:glucosamine-6-phosphate isomerase
MEIKVYSDHRQLSKDAANEIINLVKNKPNAALCLAAGDTPRLTYQAVVRQAREQNIDFSKVNFFGLDEWVGIAPSNPGSCHYFLQTELLSHLNFSKERIHLFDGLADDLTAECAKTDASIEDIGGLDLMLVGVGMNGHIGFNEPGVSFLSGTHVMELDKVTTTVGQKYFSEPSKLSRGITLGLRHLVESKKVLVLANGEKKAKIIKASLMGNMGALVPASIVQTVPQATIMLDKEAASLLENNSECI